MAWISPGVGTPTPGDIHEVSQVNMNNIDPTIVFLLDAAGYQPGSPENRLPLTLAISNPELFKTLFEAAGGRGCSLSMRINDDKQ